MNLWWIFIAPVSSTDTANTSIKCLNGDSYGTWEKVNAWMEMTASGLSTAYNLGEVIRMFLDANSCNRDGTGTQEVMMTFFLTYKTKQEHNADCQPTDIKSTLYKDGPPGQLVRNAYSLFWAVMKYVRKDTCYEGPLRSVPIGRQAEMFGDLVNCALSQTKPLRRAMKDLFSMSYKEALVQISIELSKVALLKNFGQATDPEGKRASVATKASTYNLNFDDMKNTCPLAPQQGDSVAQQEVECLETSVDKYVTKTIEYAGYVTVGLNWVVQKLGNYCQKITPPKRK